VEDTVGASAVGGIGIDHSGLKSSTWAQKVATGSVANIKMWDNMFYC